jgi:hypothetical protein
MILPSKKFGVDTQRLGCWGFNQHCRASPGIQPFETTRPLVESPGPHGRQELCDEEWISVHYKTLIHMENSGTGCPGVERGVPGDKIRGTTPPCKKWVYEAIYSAKKRIKKGVNSGLFLLWTDFQRFFCADSGEKNWCRCAWMFQCDKIEDLERQSAVSWGHVGRFRIWWT